TEGGGQFCNWFVDDRVRTTSPRLPIGRANPDMRIMIVGEDGRPVADGETGEFVIAGRYLAQGYWQDADLTAHKFTVDPTDPAIRTYKTGDWGRQRPDGLFESQRTLLAMWREVLERPDIGCDDDFFLFGGDSLSAVDLLHRVEEELKCSLPLTVLVEAP